MKPLIDQSWYHRLPEIPDRVTSGGVVVRGEGDQVLVALVREPEWTEYILPKGGVEKDEELEAAARREILEEAGLHRLRLIRKLGIIERLSFNKDHWQILHLFLFHTDQVEGKPTDTDHHYGVWWFPIEELPELVWPDQREFLIRNRSLIASDLVASTY